MFLTFLRNFFIIVLVSITLCFTASCSKTSTSAASSEKETAVLSEEKSKADINLKATKEYAYADDAIALASVHPLATQAGRDAIAAGGNAIDAALAIAFTLGVVDSHNSGIGGGLFILVHTADGKLRAIDGREMAPKKAFRDMFIRDGKADSSLSRTGALAVGIPGSVAALHELQKTSGKLTFSDVILPAAKLAETGIPVGSVLANRLSRTQSSIALFPETAEIFLPNGRLPKVGEVLVQSDLAKTYRKLAQQGPSYFYRGEFSQAVDNWMKKNKGLVSADDFKNYTTVLRKPVMTEFNGYQIAGFPPPSSGGVHVSQILNILKNYDLKSLPESDRYHLYIEAMKLAFADRAYWLGDSDFVDVPKGLISDAYAKTLALRIDTAKSNKVESHSTPENSDEDVFDKHTTHIATADAQGNWVAITTTLNTSFGSKVVIPGTGVLMNNQMDDFSAQPGVANAFGLVGAEANSIAPGKRPLSSMSPTIVLKDSAPVMTVGAAGGPTIITQVLQAIVNHLALDKPLKESLAAVRVHHQWLPDKVFIDDFASEQLQEGLQEKGHGLRLRKGFGATQAISRKRVGREWVFEAQSEPRIQ